MKKVVNELVKFIQKHQLSYDQFNNVCREARKICALEPPARKKATKRLPSYSDIKRFLSVISSKNIIDKLMMKMLLYMGMRTFELTRIEIKNIDFSLAGKEKIYMSRKGGFNKEFVIPRQLIDLLQLYLATEGKSNIYLFESKYHVKYSERTIRWKFQKYRGEAGIDSDITPHDFRRALITHLSSEGWTSRQIKLVSGHNSTASVDIYDRNNPEKIREKLNDSIAELERNLGV